MAERIQSGIDLNRSIPSTSLPATEGLILEEVKSEAGPAMNYDSAPLQTNASSSLLGMMGTSDDLRLNVPRSASPYSSPTGPLQDYLTARQFLARTKGATFSQLKDAVKNPHPNLSENALSFVRGSIPRVMNAMDLVEKVQGLAKEIAGKVMVAQEK